MTASHQDHFPDQSITHADERWQSGYVERAHGSHVVIGYLDQTRAVVRLCELALAPIEGVVEVHELMRYLLAGGRLYRIEVVASGRAQRALSRRLRR